MIDELLTITAPHVCCGCGWQGYLLCNDCKNNITFDKISVCLLCLMPCKDDGLCAVCASKVAYKKAWFVGWRKDELERLIDAYKFERAKSAHETAVDLLDSMVPQLPSDVVVVPVPTISRHIRQRGYDHTLLIAKGFAKKRGLKLERLVRRITSTSQLGKSARERHLQASEAFAVRGQLDETATYLLIDDIVTTGSTIKYAAQALREAGAREVWVAVVARQTLENN